MRRGILFALGLAALLAAAAHADQAGSGGPADPDTASIESTLQAGGPGTDSTWSSDARVSEEAGRDEMLAFMDEERQKKESRFRYLMLGYGIIWICLGVYLFGLNRRLLQVGREVEELRGRLEDARRATSR